MYLETERLIIRDWRLDDVPAYAEIVADPDVMRYIRNGSTKTYEQAERFVEERITLGAERGWTHWAVASKASGELMGFCGYGTLDGELDFGWRLAKTFWNQGYGTEAATAALRYGLETLGFDRITSVAFLENEASIRIMKKLGMRFERFKELYGKKVVMYVAERTSADTA